ncbi:MAG: hypothetical protein MUO77_05975 [Anaerolineales bacterium]|nr:hypothetical protein [Anaerolineales bacterium]
MKHKVILLNSRRSLRYLLAGWDSLREAEKLEARKILENRAESHTSASMIEEDTADRLSAGPLRPSCSKGRRVLCAVEPEQLVGLQDRILARAHFP